MRTRSKGLAGIMPFRMRLSGWVWGFSPLQTLRADIRLGLTGIAVGSERDGAVGFFDKQLLAQARDFLISGRGSGRHGETLIAYHGDGDGCCSAYFLQKLIGGPIRFYWIPTPDFDFLKAERHIMGLRPELTIFLDMPVYNRPELIEGLGHHGKVFIYDHHHPGLCDVCQGMNNVLYINPVILEEAEAFPTALFAWELLGESSRFEKDVLFMALFTESWLDRVSLFREPEDESKRERLKEIARRVHASFLVQDMNTTHYALEFLIKLGERGNAHIDAALNMKEYEILENIHRLIQNEKEWLSMRLEAEIRRLERPGFVLKRVESKMRLCGLIASGLRWKYPTLVIGIWQRWKNRFYCELRTGKDCQVNLVDLIHGIRQRAVILTGGGHPSAAAFTAEKDHFFKALSIIKEELKVLNRSGG